jgi:hypothetical protein
MAVYGHRAAMELFRISNCIAEAILQFMAMTYVCVSWNTSKQPERDVALSFMVMFSYPWPMFVVWALLIDSLWPVGFLSYAISWAFFTIMVIKVRHL